MLVLRSDHGLTGQSQILVQLRWTNSEAPT